MTHFSKLLQTAYAPAYGTKWREQYTMRVEEVESETFELRDQEPTMLQSPGKGVACFQNLQKDKVEVIDFEHFVNLFTQGLEAGRGKKCDFILAPLQHQEYIILNEVSHLREKSLSQFRESDLYQGKYEKSFAQLKSSIEKLYHSKEIAKRLENTKRKVALFSVRLKDCPESMRKKDSSLQSLATFLLPATEQKTLIVNQGLPHGFVYERRFYPNALSLNG